MVETSGSPSLDPRQACSVEAAARRSGLGVVVVMVSERLDLTDNTTCFLLNSDLNIEFYTVNLTRLAFNTSIGNKVQYMRFLYELIKPTSIFQKLSSGLQIC